MSLTIIKTNLQTGRAILALAAVVVVFGMWFGAKWNFANALSTRAELKEIADLAVSLAPSDPQTRFAAAAIFRKTFSTENQDRSLAEYEQVAALAPHNFISWLELGNARERNGDSQGAELALKKALDLAPNYADVQWAYGNALVRAGKTDAGFSFISSAATSNPAFCSPAVVTAMELFDGDIARVREKIAETPAANTALAAYLVRQKRYDEALATWGRVPASLQSAQMKDGGSAVGAALRKANQFRAAAKVLGDLYPGGTERPDAGRIFDGGFEAGVKLTAAPDFEWQIPVGAEPQIAISKTQKHGGASSLLIAFNSTQASDFRSVGQLASADPGGVYEFEFYYRSDLKTTSTVRWEIVSPIDSTVIALSEPVAAISDWAAVKTKLTMPALLDGVIIRLVRDRCPSTVCPISGSLWLDDVSIRKL